ncbi:uncharacterized protein LOC130761063 isoform X2 [Actinidia eriantha]|uniref:uncharacterized protein LOC130761063 isoform X2 n=1 Tax=Actinidia eriantha TaxID=165200 RepID=UPI0025845B97|nr:uncharacterized protein LOC130761063 isoform X2 [Actinidia eriantha]
MVYITSWDDFVDRSVQLFRASPESTRYVLKYRHCDGKLVLKVTDDREDLKYMFGVEEFYLALEDAACNWYFRRDIHSLVDNVDVPETHPHYSAELQSLVFFLDNLVSGPLDRLIQGPTLPLRCS